jgi:hypothetical protein
MRNIPASATTPRPVDLQNSDSAACTCYRNFPIMGIERPKLKPAAFCQASASRKFLAASAYAQDRMHFLRANSRRNPVTDREVVSMLDQNL